jgi:hypothetical protein
VKDRPGKKNAGPVLLAVIAVCVCLFGLIGAVSAADSETSRRTLTGLRGVYVLIEELQPNIVQLSDKFNFGKERLRKDMESRLRRAGIRILGNDEWLASPGRPILYLVINTHQREKYWWAYDVRIELQQMSSLEVNPATKTLVSTWSTNMTGIVNLGTLHVLAEQAIVLTDLFINAFFTANPPVKRPKPAPYPAGR